MAGVELSAELLERGEESSRSLGISAQYAPLAENAQASGSSQILPDLERVQIRRFFCLVALCNIALFVSEVVFETLPTAIFFTLCGIAMAFRIGFHASCFPPQGRGLAVDPCCRLCSRQARFWIYFGMTMFLYSNIAKRWELYPARASSVLALMMFCITFGTIFLCFFHSRVSINLAYSCMPPPTGLTAAEAVFRTFALFINVGYCLSSCWVALLHFLLPTFSVTITAVLLASLPFASRRSWGSGAPTGYYESEDMIEQAPYVRELLVLQDPTKGWLQCTVFVGYCGWWSLVFLLWFFNDAPCCPAERGFLSYYFGARASLTPCIVGAVGPLALCGLVWMVAAIRTIELLFLNTKMEKQVAEKMGQGTREAREAAKADMKESARVKKLIFGEQHWRYGELLADHAALYLQMADFVEAENRLTEADTILKAAGKADSSFYGNLQTTRVMMYMSTGRPHRTLDIVNKICTSEAPLKAKETLLSALTWEIAREAAKRAPAQRHQWLEVIQQWLHHCNTGCRSFVLHELSRSYKQTQRLDDAIETMEKVRQIEAKSSGVEHPNYAQALTLLADLLHSARQDPAAASRDDEAFRHCKEACRIYRSVLEGALGALPTRERLNFVQSLDGALRLLLAVAKQMKVDGLLSDEHVLDCFFAVAFQKNLILDSQVQEVDPGNLEGEALEQVRQLRAQLTDARKLWAASALERWRVSSPSDASLHTSAASYEQRSQDVDHLEQKLHGALPSKGRGSSNMTAAEFMKKIKGLLQTRLAGAAVVEFALSGKTEVVEDSYCAFVLTTSDQAETETSGLYLLFLEDADTVDGNVKDFQAKMGLCYRTFVKYVNYRDRGAALKANEALAKLGEAKRKQIEVGRLLYEELLDPVLAVLSAHKEQSGGTLPTHLFLALEGEIAQLPFAALALPQGAEVENSEVRYVLDEEYTISYLSASRDLLQFEAASVKGSSRLCRVIASPAFDADVPDAQSGARLLRQMPQQQSFEFGPLDGASEEGQLISDLLQQRVRDCKVVLLQGAEATKAKLFEEGPSPWLLHIATHGYFVDYQEEPTFRGRSFVATERALRSSEEPLLRCGLALAGAHQWERQGVMPEKCTGLVTGLELCSLDLTETKLVTLAACETGLGAVTLSQGIFGLGRAVQIAGAESVLSSLWSIADLESKDLFCEFYKLLVEETASGNFHRAVALRDAQRKLHKRPSDQGDPFPSSHPFYWGPFVLSGAVGTVL